MGNGQLYSLCKEVSAQAAQEATVQSSAVYSTCVHTAALDTAPNQALQPFFPKNNTHSLSNSIINLSDKIKVFSHGHSKRTKIFTCVMTLQPGQ